MKEDLHNPEDTYYRLAPGVEVLLVGEDGLLFRSDAVALRLDGASARFFGEKVVPVLNGSRSLAELTASLPGLSMEDLQVHLEELTAAKVLVRESVPAASANPKISDPFFGFLQNLGVPVDEARERLSTLCVMVAGLESVGSQVADLLDRTGLGTLILVDPFPCRPEDLALMPLFSSHAVGRQRQEVLSEALKERGGGGHYIIRPDMPFDRSSLLELTQEADFLVSCFDRDFSAVNHWINRAALDAGIPALFGQLHGYRAVAGPLVIPEETPCFMCARMRSLACAEDFAEAMAFEELLDARRHPSREREPSIPSSASVLAGLLATELIKTVLAIGTPALSGKILVFNALEGRMDSHTLLQRPDCPICSKKKRQPPPQPPLDELIQNGGVEGDPLAVSTQLVSRQYGIVRDFKRLNKDQSEPERPYIYRAELANSRFLEKNEDAFVVCSGKGMTQRDAQTSALGEAVERYSSGLWGEDRILRSSRDNLSRNSLDPNRLVLYRSEQYAQLPFVPYNNETILGWVCGRSLGTGDDLYIPALAALMAYEVKKDEGYIFPITSNGLAAGPTLPDAVLAGAFEVFERDAFLNLWLHRLPTEKIDPFEHPDQDMVALTRSYSRRGVEMELYRIPMDHPVHIFIGLGVDEKAKDSPAVVVGLGADLDPVRAARSALLEVAQVRPALRMRLRDPETRKRIAQLLDDPSKVTDLTDHDLLYCSLKRLDCFDFMRKRQTEPFDWGTGKKIGVADALPLLIHCLREQGSDLIYCNLTTSDMAQLGLYCARAIVPDYQPIHFGRLERRLGGSRLYQLPRLLGLQQEDARPEDLNGDPHPLA